MFSIKIVESTTVPVKNQAWQKVADSGNPKDGGAVFDYVSTDSVQRRDREVLSMEMEKLDIVVVVKAMLGL